MAITIKRKEGEPLSSFLYRVGRRIQQSGILLEAKKRKFREYPPSRNARKESKVLKMKMQYLIQKFLKQGYPVEEAVDRARKILKDIIKK
jgi:ribosomal protein S21